MGASNGHVLYVGTTDGLYLAEPADGGYAARPFGFPGREFRTPVLVDCDDASTLFAGTTETGMFRSRDAGQTWEEINAGITYTSRYGRSSRTPATGRCTSGRVPPASM